MAILKNKKTKSSIKTIFKRIVSSKKPDKKVIKKKVLLDIKPDNIKKVLVKKNTTKKTIFKNKLILKKKKFVLAKKKLDKKFEKKEKEKENPYEDKIKLKKVSHNPIISPTLYSWESKATFNPAAFLHQGKVYIVYRAIGEDDSSVLGCAVSLDGLNIENRLTHFIYKRFFELAKVGEKIDYVSGGGWSGGCEDPRITLIDDTIYMLYNAFDGWGSIRVGLTSIKLNDFTNKKWNWKKGVLISPVGERHKNWVLFPEKINNKFVILHNIHSDDLSRIRVEYFDNLEEEDFKKANFESPDPNALPDRPCGWHSRMRSVGPPPVKTKIGWLVLYHAMGINEPNKYKLGAMILDLKDPTKVLYRSNSPILEPDEVYEKREHQGIVYSCGAVIKNKNLYVYYGGGDKFVCVASVSLQELVDSMKKDKIIKLKNTSSIENK